ncbi:MAG: MiaB/RimO family radical SAM methylthiotransferase [bacterium]|nr:MiaB/RimO family radical SAM methylthiotransferase [bacterium]
MRFAIHVFGCRLNQAEAAEWRAALEAHGWQSVAPEKAALIAIHSCAVTETAVQEVRRMIRLFRQKYPLAKLILSGCAAGLIEASLVDGMIPHAEKASWVARVLALEPTVVAPVVKSRPKTRASLIVQDGCDQFCAYCIVPYMRGKPTSEPMSQLLKQAEALFAEGYQEIVLTGCHLALYRDPETGAGLLTLLQRLAEVKGTGRFRLSSLEPGLLDDRALVDFIADARERFCAFLHLPLQTGSDTLLKAMGRRYTVKDVRGLLDHIVNRLPLAGLGADWIVGLPGETDADAQATCDLVEAYPFTGAHIFPYSRRPGTAAADFPHHVPQHLQHARVQQLTALANAKREALMPRYLGRDLFVIPERQREGFWEGWSAERLRCRLPAEAVRGVGQVFRPTHYANGIFHA